MVNLTAAGVIGSGMQPDPSDVNFTLTTTRLARGFREPENFGAFRSENLASCTASHPHLSLADIDRNDYFGSDYVAFCEDIALLAMEAAHSQLKDCAGHFDYCGDFRALRVDLRVGYVQTNHPHLLVKWMRP